MFRTVILASLTIVVLAAPPAESSELPATLSATSSECVECHRADNPGIYQQWGASKHFGANVGCHECHAADAADTDVLRDGIHDDYVISTIVSPKDSRCHSAEVDEFLNSHHSKAGRIMGSLDNLLAEVVEGNNGFVTPAFPEGISAAAVNGCWQCHGSVVMVDPETGRLDPATWPNTGIGRVNPDGSEGSCTACHQRHAFSAEQARHPDNCGKCHLGPDHPQKEIYEESKHGIAFRANIDKMNLDSSKWIVGEDYTAAPTCATCHMSATPTQPLTHNVGLRIKWNNRPVHSTLAHLTDEKWGLASAEIHSDQRREDVKDVCVTCHQASFTDNFFMQYEGLITLYEEKYAVPGEALYAAAVEVLKVDPRYAKFSHKIDYTWFELWHHEGRRARHAASMQAPDYTHWHGTYDLAKNWNGHFVPEIREIIHDYRDRAPQKVAALEALLEETLASPNHRWSINQEDEAVKREREARQKEFQDRYRN